MKSDLEKQLIVEELKRTLNYADDDATRDAIQAKIWVVSFNVTDEDDIFDRNLEPESEAAAFRAQEWLLGRLSDNALISI